MLHLLEQRQRLTTNQWKIFVACLLSMTLDFFDFMLIGYVLPFFVEDWHLTFGQSALVLMASGVSAIPGGIFFGWLGDRIGRRKVFVITTLIFSFASGLMALTPHGAWPLLVAMRLVVGLGTAGVMAVDLPLLQEFVPASKRGWVSGLSLALLPVGPLLAAALCAHFGALLGWRGLFAVGLFPAVMALLIRAWVPESPRWLMMQGQLAAARRSLAWALEVDPAEIPLPAASEASRPPWRTIFRYPRSIAAAAFTGLSQTASVGLALWQVTLLVLVLRIPPAHAAFLSIWIALIGIAGRTFGAWLSDVLGRRHAGALSAIAAAAAMLVAGGAYDAHWGTLSMFYLMLLVHSFFANSNFSVVYPYMVEVWPSRLRASGFGLVYGCSSLGKVIGPAGLAVITGAATYVAPQATIEAIGPGFTYFAFWYGLAIVGFLFVGIETKGRSIDELDASLQRSTQAAV